MLVKVSERGTITIPKELRGQLPEGGLMEVVLRDDGVIELRPQVAIDATQAWFWTQRWQRMEREADDDFSAGRFQTFDDAESFLADLDQRSGGGHGEVDAEPAVRWRRIGDHRVFDEP